MRKLLLVILGLVALPELAVAHVSTITDCETCQLGLFDGQDLTMTTNCGTMMTGMPKDVFLAVRLAGPETGVTGVEFSIAGIRSDVDGILVVGTEPIVPAAVMLGS